MEKSGDNKEIVEQQDGSRRILISRDKSFTIWKYDQIQEGSSFARRYTEAYARVFNARGKGEWNADFSLDQGRKDLEEDLRRGEIKIKLITMEDQQNVIHGFAYGYLINSDCIGLREAPFHLEKGEKGVVIEIVKKKLREKIEGENIIYYFGPLGIIQESRSQGILRLQRLGGAMLEEIVREGVKHILSYTSRDSKLYLICKFMGAQELFNINDDRKTVYLLQDIDILSFSEYFSNGISM